MSEDTEAPALIRVLIADEIAHIVEELAQLGEYADEVEVCGIVRAGGDIVAEAQALQPDVLLLSSALGDEGIDRLAQDLMPVAPMTRILVSASTGIDDGHVPPGAADVVPAGVPGLALIGAIRHVHRTRPQPPEIQAPIREPARRRTRESGAPGDVIVVYAAKGGAGTSLVATNLATSLAVETRTSVALVDLDLQYGDTGRMLHIENHLTAIDDLAAQREWLDADLVDDVLASGPAGVRVLLPPASPELVGMVTAADVRAILQQLRATHDHVVVDIPAHLEDRTVDVIEQADRILMVTALSDVSVRRTAAALALFAALDVDGDRIALVLNQTHEHVAVSRDDVEQRLRVRALAHLPYEPRVDDAIDRGRPLVLLEHESDLAEEMRALARHLTPHAEEEPPAAADQDEEGDAEPQLGQRRRFSLGRR